jgi:mismatch-specific thymine-DNA glycosylase
MRKQNDRFNGVTEEELYSQSLNDIVDFDLDIVFVNINPGLYSVFKQHHYSGPGNHFCESSKAFFL